MCSLHFLCEQGPAGAALVVVAAVFWRRFLTPSPTPRHPHVSAFSTVHPLLRTLETPTSPASSRPLGRTVSSQQVTNDIGMDAKDTGAMKANLEAQGLEVSGLALTGSVSNVTEPPPGSPSKRAPSFARATQGTPASGTPMKNWRGAGESSIVFG